MSILYPKAFKKFQQHIKLRKSIMKSEVLYKKAVPKKIFQQACSFIKKTLQHRCFLDSSAKFLGTVILKNICQRSSLIYNTSGRHAQPECRTSDKSAYERMTATQVRHELYERHECDRSEKVLILITTRVKTYFHTPIFTIWQMKDHKKRNNFILSPTFGNGPFPCQNVFESAPQKLNFVMTKAILKGYTLN